MAYGAESMYAIFRNKQLNSVQFISRLFTY